MGLCLVTNAHCMAFTRPQQSGHTTPPRFIGHRIVTCTDIIYYRRPQGFMKFELGWAAARAELGEDVRQVYDRFGMAGRNVTRMQEIG